MHAVKFVCKKYRYGMKNNKVKKRCRISLIVSRCDRTSQIATSLNSSQS